MTKREHSGKQRGGVAHVIAAFAVIFSLLPMMSSTVAAADTATITVNSFLDDGTTPLAFARFQITDSNGIVYGPLESSPVDGTVTFTVAADGVTTYTLIEETPPACGIAPEPIEIQALGAGDSTSVDVITSFDTDCTEGSISAYSYLCPDGTDASGSDYAEFSGNCVETQDGVAVAFRTADGSQQWDRVTGAYGISGRAPLVGLVPGDYVVQVTPPDNDTQTVVFCLAFTGTPGSAGDLPTVTQQTVDADGVTISLNGERIACDFFSVPSDGNAPAPEPTSIATEEAEPTEAPVDESVNDAVLEVHLSACPEGYTGEDYFADCHDNGIAGRVITADGPSGYEAAFETSLVTDPGPGVVIFSELAKGTYKIWHDLPGDTTTYYAFCSLAESDEVVPFEYDDSTSEAITLKVPQSAYVVCDFYIIANETAVEEPTQEPTAAPQPTEAPVEEAADDGTLEVHLSLCPAGYSGTSYFEDCHANGIEGRVITADGPSGYEEAFETSLVSDPGPGVVVFSGMPAGSYKVWHDIPGDATTYYAYCSMAGSDEVVPFEYDDSTSEAIVLSLGESDDVVCDFYIIGEPQYVPGKISITKYTCPVGYSSDAYGDLAADCVDPTNDVTFTLASDTTQIDKVTGNNGEGRVAFANLAPGSYAVSESVPGEFSQPVVWCNLGGNGEWYQKDVAGGATVFDVDEGDDIRCSWFNLPEDLRGGGSLRIHKSLCPAGLTSGYYTNCYENTLADVTFVADGPGGSSESLVTGNNGVVTFTDLAAGTYTITELPPASVNTAVYVVVCTRDGNTYDFTYDDSTGLRINIEVPSGAEIVCDWYNVPPKKEDPNPPSTKGGVTVVKYLCQGRTDNKYNWDTDCESYGAGAEFDLTSVSSGKVTSGTTGNDGKLVFSNLANGAYELDETSGDWCHAEADHVDANGNVLVQNKSNTNVYVYNCSKKVNTLPSTGTGPGSPTSTGSAAVFWGVASLTEERRVFEQRLRGCSMHIAN